MQHTVVVGTQWGDEGKGKIVDTLARHADSIIRFQGGNNAGHTVVANGVKHAFHLLPSGVLHQDKTCVIGSGVIIDPLVLASELTRLTDAVGDKHAKIIISDLCHLIMPWHRIVDSITGGKIGTTSRGIGPTYTDAIARTGIRLIDTRDLDAFAELVRKQAKWYQSYIQLLLDFHQVPKAQQYQLVQSKELDPDTIVSSYVKALKHIAKIASITDTAHFLHQQAEKDVALLFEGAQATLLDITYGTYPYVTSSHPTVGGVYTGTGFRPRHLHVIGVAKAYTTRVGEGPFPTELNDDVGQHLLETGHEYGTTTGRPRRCGWLDLPILRYAKRINGLDCLAITKLDVLSGLETLKVATSYYIEDQEEPVFTPHAALLEKAEVKYESLSGWQEDITGVRSFSQLPKAAKEYIMFIEDSLKINVAYIGIGPDREQVILR